MVNKLKNNTRKFKSIYVNSTYLQFGMTETFKFLGTFSQLASGYKNMNLFYLSTACSECRMLLFAHVWLWKQKIFPIHCIGKTSLIILLHVQTPLLLQHPSSSRQTIPSATWISSSLMLILRISSGTLHQRHGSNSFIQSTYYRVCCPQSP